MLCGEHTHSFLNQSLKIFSAEEGTLYFPTSNRPIKTMLKLQGVAFVFSFNEFRGTKTSSGSFPTLVHWKAGFRSEVQRPHFELFTLNKKLHLSVDELFTFKMGPPAEGWR